VNERRRAATHVIVDDVTVPVLADDDRHHLVRVLRLRDGETVSVTDGRGSWRLCAWSSGELRPTTDIVREPDRAPLGVAFALCKSDKPETIVQKLTELGVDLIVPFVSTRSVVKWDDDKADRNLDRWRKVAREAVMQSRQVFVPRIEPLVASVADLVARHGGGLAVAEPEGGPIGAGVSVIAVGPEGGFTDEEIACFGSTVGLPGGVLRAETAAVVAGTLLVARR
jgi:16S rRNA (uracil1498-N3)-methyltransferase